MTERDDDAWWSPIPGPVGGPAPAEAPAAPPPASADRARRRWPWFVGGATALVVLACAVLGVALGRAGTQTLMDPAGTVAVAVPRSWYDNTGDRSSDPGSPPVLAASNLWQSRWMEVVRFDVDEGTDLRSFHEEGVDEECGSWTCTHRSTPRALTVGGHDALEQVVTHASDADGGASSSLTLTVWLDDEAVELYVVATAVGSTPPDPAPLETIAASLRFL